MFLSPKYDLCIMHTSTNIHKTHIGTHTYCIVSKCKRGQLSQPFLKCINQEYRSVKRVYISHCGFERNCTPPCRRKSYFSQNSTINVVSELCEYTQTTCTMCNYATHPLVLKWQIKQLYRYNITIDAVKELALPGIKIVL